MMQMLRNAIALVAMEDNGLDAGSRWRDPIPVPPDRKLNSVSRKPNSYKKPSRGKSKNKSSHKKSYLPTKASKSYLPTKSPKSSSSSKSYLPTSSPNQIPRRPKAFTFAFDYDYDLGGLPPPPPPPPQQTSFSGKRPQNSGKASSAGNPNGKLPRRGKSRFQEDDEINQPPSLKVEEFFPDPQPPHPLLFQPAQLPLSAPTTTVPSLRRPPSPSTPSLSPPPTQRTTQRRRPVTPAFQRTRPRQGKQQQAQRNQQQRLQQQQRQQQQRQRTQRPRTSPTPSSVVVSQLPPRSRQTTSPPPPPPPTSPKVAHPFQTTFGTSQQSSRPRRPPPPPPTTAVSRPRTPPPRTWRPRPQPTARPSRPTLTVPPQPPPPSQSGFRQEVDRFKEAVIATVEGVEPPFEEGAPLRKQQGLGKANRQRNNSNSVGIRQQGRRRQKPRGGKQLYLDEIESPKVIQKKVKQKQKPTSRRRGKQFNSFSRQSSSTSSTSSDLTEIPETSFRCSDQAFPGLYADVEANCQVFHMCQLNGRANAFLCPVGTLFDQRHLVCNWWNKVDCSAAPSLYFVNENIYQ